MKKILFGLSCFLSMSLFAQSFQPVWQMKKGDKYLVTTTIQTTASQMMMESKSNIVMGIEAEVTAVDSFSTVSCTNKNLQVKANLMNKQIDFDSQNKKDSSKAGAILKDWLNQKSIIRFDSKANATVSGQAQTEPSFDMDMEKMVASNVLSQINQSNNVEMAFNKFFGKKLKVGENFKDSSSTEGLTNVTIYTLQSVENDVAIFKVDGKQEMSGTREMMGQPTESKGNGTTTGEFKVDAKTGMIIQQKLLVDTKLNIRFNGMDIPMDSKSEFQILVTRL